PLFLKDAKTPMPGTVGSMGWDRRASRRVNRGIIGAVRSALLVERDPEDPTRRVIAPVKQNLCEPGAAVAFSLEPAGKAVRVVWTGETARTSSTRRSGLCTGTPATPR